ncbi:MAG: OmpH family outer membrane protein [Pseudomonadota bacterium]
MVRFGPAARLQAVLLALLLALGPGPVAAQDAGAQAPILTIDSERFFSESAFGRRIAAEIEAATTDLAAENRRIEATLTKEEQDLTDQRADLPPDEFRSLADAFDLRVQRIRREQEAKARALVDRSDADRLAFLRAARPVLGQVMREAGASVILERASVFFSSNASDITDRAVRLIDASIGDGADQSLEEPVEDPEQP